MTQPTLLVPSSDNNTSSRYHLLHENKPPPAGSISENKFK
uniref:Uncharacterized protein n=1 Tax=Triticum urartu TaxID=4572 RepID=A0A8R7PRJ6_TRIUA